MASEIQSETLLREEEITTYDVNLPYKPDNGAAHGRTDFPL